MKSKTDVCLDFKNAPFITCWESDIPNLWYSEVSEFGFLLTSQGFRVNKVARTKTEYLKWKKKK